MDEQTIRQTAYRIWEQQGKPDGQDFVHWIQAMDELQPSDTDGLPGSIESSVSPPGLDPAAMKTASSAPQKNMRSKRSKT